MRSDIENLKLRLRSFGSIKELYINIIYFSCEKNTGRFDIGVLFYKLADPKMRYFNILYYAYNIVY